jgi:hypothetical protein
MFKLFKKQKPQPEVVHEIEEVKVYSRLTFAHNPENIMVFKFYFRNKETSKYINMPARSCFVYKPILHNPDEIIYPVFIMPSKLPKTIPVSNKKIICIGALRINNSTSEILAIVPDFTGCNLGQINDDYWRDTIDNNSTVIPMTMDNAITFSIIEGDIDFTTYERSITLNNALTLMTRDNEITVIG